MKIKHADLKKIDNLYHEFNNLYNVFLDQLNRISNPVALEEILTHITELRKRLKKLRPTEFFDKLVAEHLMHSLNAQEYYAKYFTGTVKNYDKLIDDVNGKWLKYAKQNVKNYDYKSSWHMMKLNADFYGKLIHADDPKVQKVLEKLVPHIKKLVLDYGKKLGILPSKFNFDISLMPTHRQRSYYLPEINRLELDSNEFWCFIEKGSIHVNCMCAMRTMFHEILGHAAHKVHSAKMPKSLQFDNSTSYMLVNRPHKEGIALNQHPLIFDALTSIKHKIIFTKQDLKRIELDEAVTISNISFQLYFSYLKAKEKFNPKFKVKDELYKTTKNPGIARYYKEKPSYHDVSLIREIAYLTGLRLVSNIKQKYHKSKKINQALLSGCWSWKVLPKFIRYFHTEI
ncbi:hypothetical protein K9M79_00460 [Candidatus Woesearchaeota archaeon]|nr:hypothetical protein [Candidatus Woesearchaeota archaeon]